MLNPIRNQTAVNTNGGTIQSVDENFDYNIQFKHDVHQ